MPSVCQPCLRLRTSDQKLEGELLSRRALRLLPERGGGQGGETDSGGSGGAAGEVIRVTGVVYYTCPSAMSKASTSRDRGHRPETTGRSSRPATLSLRPALSLRLIRLREIKHTSGSEAGEGERKREAKRAQTKKLTAQVSLDVGQNYNEIEETRRAELRREMGVQRTASCRQLPAALPTVQQLMALPHALYYGLSLPGHRAWEKIQMQLWKSLEQSPNALYISKTKSFPDQFLSAKPCLPAPRSLLDEECTYLYRCCPTVHRGRRPLTPLEGQDRAQEGRRDLVTCGRRGLTTGGPGGLALMSTHFVFSYNDSPPSRPEPRLTHGRQKDQSRVTRRQVVGLNMEMGWACGYLVPSGR